MVMPLSVHVLLFITDTRTLEMHIVNKSTATLTPPGRVYDNEEEEWMRRNIAASETNLDAEWVMNAAKANAGRNMGSYSSTGNFQNLGNYF